MNDFEQRLRWAAERLDKLRNAIESVLIGQRDAVEHVITALLASGHVLLEGAPGLGKTLLVKTLANCVDLQFSRIQFTPDLMPSDVIGTNVLVEQPGGGRTFALHRGPIFGQVILADEINRATPKTQSALLEAMQEATVTIAGQKHALGPPFFVLATENPIEMEGTYPLPEAQLDRFLLKALIPEPNEDDLVTVLEHTTGAERALPAAVLTKDEVLALRTLCREIAVSNSVLRFAARLVRGTSPTSPDAPAVVKRAVRYGASVRGAQSLVLCAKAIALAEDRANVAFQDIVRVAKPALRHRIIRSFEGEADGLSPDDLITAAIDAIPMRPDAVEQAVAEARAR